MSSVWLDPEQRCRVLAYLEGAFGIPAVAWEGHRFLARGDYVYALAEEAAGACEAFRWVAAGLRILKASGSGGFKPTSSGVQAFGRWATRRVRDLGDDELRALLSGQRLVDSGEEDGPVILRWQGLPLGMGFVRDGHLVSQVPRAVTEHLRLPGRPAEATPDPQGASQPGR